MRSLLPAGVVFMIGIVGCGGAEPGNVTGSALDRTDLVVAAAGTVNAGFCNTVGSECTGYAALEEQGLSLERTLKCDQGGNLSFSFSVAPVEDKVTQIFEGKLANCGEQKLTGSISIRDDSTTDFRQGTTQGNLTIRFSGSSGTCRTLAGSFTGELTARPGTQIILLSGNLSGTCRTAASCSFEAIELPTNATEAQIRQKLYEACDLPDPI